MPAGPTVHNWITDDVRGKSDCEILNEKISITAREVERMRKDVEELKNAIKPDPKVEPEAAEPSAEKWEEVTVIGHRHERSPIGMVHEVADGEPRRFKATGSRAIGHDFNILISGGIDENPHVKEGDQIQWGTFTLRAMMDSYPAYLHGGDNSGEYFLLIRGWEVECEKWGSL